MRHSDKATKLIGACVAVAAYFALAEWSRRSYVDPTPAGKLAVRLNRPFERFGKVGVASYQLQAVEQLEQVGDSEEAPGRSPVLLYEGGRLLGPAHSSNAEIAERGQGRYSHLKGGLFFSSSDSTDPNGNGRVYWAVLP
jgi:hypothetical protein